MAASINDKLTNTASTTSARPQPTQVTSTRSAGVFTLSCNALTGWPTDTKVHFATYKLNTAGAKIVGSQIDMDGIVSGTSIGSITIRGGTDVGNAIGDIVEMAPTAAWGYDLNKWGTVHADAAGNLLTAAVQAALGLTSLNGYTPLGATPNTVTYNGNRSYDLVFNSTDLTSVISNGMRLRTTRTVAAPTQCTNLNGTTQFYSKTSPAGMTFTNNFVAGAWVKLTSYAQATIASRFNATSGWMMQVSPSGQVNLQGFNAGIGNVSYVQSYQSIPLNKWVHVTAQLDMSAFTATTTTSYVMIDGVDVPSTVARAGTNPTALVQAGNLEIGSYNGGTNPFPGKIAQAFVTSSKLTQTQVRAIYSQGLTSADMATYSIVSAYSFNNSINDINTTNANNLTANGSAVATNADSPFTQDDTGTPSGTNDFAIITKKAFSTNTTITVQVPEGCTIPTIGGVSAVVYSSNKVPYGFPNSSDKWTLQTIFLASTTHSAGAVGTIYNIAGANLSLTTGSWNLSGLVQFQTQSNGTTHDVTASLSTSSSALTDMELSDRVYLNQAAGAVLVPTFSMAKPVVTTTQTPYYLLYVTQQALTANPILAGSVSATIPQVSKIMATLAYL